MTLNRRIAIPAVIALSVCLAAPVTFAGATTQSTRADLILFTHLIVLPTVGCEQAIITVRQAYPLFIHDANAGQPDVSGLQQASGTAETLCWNSTNDLEFIRIPAGLRHSVTVKDCLKQAHTLESLYRQFAGESTSLTMEYAANGVSPLARSELRTASTLNSMAVVVDKAFITDMNKISMAIMGRR